MRLGTFEEERSERASGRAAEGSGSDNNSDDGLMFRIALLEEGPTFGVVLPRRGVDAS